MKYLAFFAAILVGTLTFAASKPPNLDKAQALQLALDYAHEQKWDIKNVPGDATFNEAKREWQVFINTKQNGGPMIVYVDDETRKVRFARGE